MPIKWSALKVSEAADKIEKLFNQAVEPLEQARIVAREARNLANLPQYIDQDLTRIISEIDRAIGGSQFEPIGRIRSGVEAIRKDIPDGAIEAERESAKHGTTHSLI
jgi:hypothetical protein